MQRHVIEDLIRKEEAEQGYEKADISYVEDKDGVCQSFGVTFNKLIYYATDQTTRAISGKDYHFDADTYSKQMTKALGLTTVYIEPTSSFGITERDTHNSLAVMPAKVTIEFYSVNHLIDKLNQAGSYTALVHQTIRQENVRADAQGAVVFRPTGFLTYFDEDTAIRFNQMAPIPVRAVRASDTAAFGFKKIFTGQKKQWGDKEGNYNTTLDTPLFENPTFGHVANGVLAVGSTIGTALTGGLPALLPVWLSLVSAATSLWIAFASLIALLNNEFATKCLSDPDEPMRKKYGTHNLFSSSSRVSYFFATQATRNSSLVVAEAKAKHFREDQLLASHVGLCAKP